MTDEAVALFCSITGADNDSAAHFLGASGGDVEVAVGLFMDSRSGGNGGALSAGPAAVVEPEEVRQPIRPTRTRLVDDAEGDTSHWVEQPSITLSWTMGRAPFASTFAADLSTERGRRLAALFQSPTAILFPGATFDAARKAARQQHRYLVATLHDPTEFVCQCLNRDLWNQLAIQDFIREHLICFQMTVGMPEADRYMRLYGVTEHPHVALVDPRTGKAVRVWSRLPEPADFMADVIEVMERSPLGLKPASTLPSPTSPIVIGDDDEDAQIMIDSPSAQLEPLQIPDEPPTDAVDATTLQFRLPDGSRKRRRFLLSGPVRDLFAFVASCLPQGKSFDLLEHTRSLSGVQEESLEAQGLKNASLNIVEL